MYSSRIWRYSDIEETKTIFRFVEGLFPKVKHYVQLQQQRTLQYTVQVAEKIGSILWQVEPKCKAK